MIRQLFKERGNPCLRWADRYLGIPFIVILGLFKRKRKIPNSLNNIAFLKTAGIGDTVLLSAVIKDFQAAYPQAKITLFTGRSNAAMARMIRNVEVVPLPMTNPYASLRFIRKSAYDLWIDCDPWPRVNAFLSFFSRSLYSIGFKTEGQYRHYVYDQAITHSFENHELDNYRSLFPIRSEREKPAIALQGCMSKKVALHLYPGGSRAYLKEWPEDYWKSLIQFFLEEGYEIALTGAEREKPLLNRFVLSDKVTNYAGKLSLQDTSKLLKSCMCVVSVDTGIMHLAAALDCPLIALHGPTSPERWGAVSDKVIALTPKFKYKPCIQLGFESKCKKSCCMGAISVEQVKEAFEQLRAKL